MNTTSQLATVPAPGQLINTLDDMERVSKAIAASGLFGFTKPEQAFCLLLLSQAEGINPALALRQFHLIEGKFSMRSDAMAGKYEQAGGLIMWHLRSDKECSATFFTEKRKVDEAAIERAKTRYVALRDGDEKTASKNAYPGEECVIRTLADAIEKELATSWEKDADGKFKKGTDGKFVKGLKKNWAQSPRQMLTARVITEGVRLMNPGLIAGIVSEDEARDIADQTQERFQELVDEPDNRDRDAMEEILAQHERSADAAKTDQERKHYQGLAAEMRCLIADLDVQPAFKAISATIQQTGDGDPVVQSAENEGPELTDKEPTKLAKLASEDRDWRAVDFSHKNPKTSSPIYGRTVGDIYATGGVEKAWKIDEIIRMAFTDPMDKAIKAHEDGDAPAPNSKDMELWDAIQKGRACLMGRTPASSNQGDASIH